MASSATASIAASSSPFNLLALRELAGKVHAKAKEAMAVGPWGPTEVILEELQTAISELQEAGTSVTVIHEREALRALVETLKLMPDPEPDEAAVEEEAASTEVAAVVEEVPRPAAAAAPERPATVQTDNSGAWTLDRIARFLSTAMKYELPAVLGASVEGWEDGWVNIDLLAHHLIVANWETMRHNTNDDVLSLIARAVKTDPQRFEISDASCEFVRYVWRDDRSKGKGKGKPKGKRQRMSYKNGKGTNKGKGPQTRRR